MDKAGEVVQGYATKLEAEEAHRLILGIDEHGHVDARWESPHRPFFIYLAWHAPHSPHQRIPEAKRYEDRGFRAGVRANRMGQIEALDKGVKHVLNAVDSLPPQARDHTLVVFFSDNGAPSYPPFHHNPSSHYKSSRSKHSATFSPGHRFLLDHLGRSHSLSFGVATEALLANSRKVQEDMGPVIAKTAFLRERSPDSSRSSSSDPYPTNKPLLGYKGSLYEGGIRTFAVARWGRNIDSGAISHEPFHVSDWMPTFLLLALGNETATPVLEQLDGVPVLPIITGTCSLLNLKAKSGCRGRPVYVSSGLPVLERADGSWDSARMKEWIRDPGLSPLLYAERGALISPNGQCKFFLDPDDWHASSGTDLRTGKTSPSGQIIAGRYPPERLSNSTKGASERNKILAESLDPSSWRKWAVFNEAAGSCPTSARQKSNCDMVQVEHLRKAAEVTRIRACTQLDRHWESRSRHLESTYRGSIRRLEY